MATTKIWDIKGRIDLAVNYATDPSKTENPEWNVSLDKTAFAAMDYTMRHEKTEKAYYVTGINCLPDTAKEQMLLTKKRWGKDSKILLFHAEQSFASGETTPDTAHEIGVKLAKQLWGKRFEVIVSTHLDTLHLHNHFIINSVSFIDGKKYNDCKDSYHDMRNASDALCREYGLSVIPAPEQKVKSKHYSEWAAEKEGKPTIRSLIRQDIDAHIDAAYTFNTFVRNLQAAGYAIKMGERIKYMAVRPPGAKRFIRLASLGDGYAEGQIRMRIQDARENEKRRSTPTVPKAHVGRYRSNNNMPLATRKLSGFQALYFRYLYALGKVRRKVAPPRINRYLYNEARKFEQHRQAFDFLHANDIRTTEHLSYVIQVLEQKIETLVSERTALQRSKKMLPCGEQVNCTASIAEITQTLRMLRKKLRIANRILESIPEITAQIRLLHHDEKHIRKEVKDYERRRTSR